jgi:hypothetical protein
LDEVGEPLHWAPNVCHFEPGLFEPLYAGLVALGELDSMIATLQHVRIGSWPDCFGKALEARRRRLPAFDDRAKPILAFCKDAFHAGVTPDPLEYYHPDGWIALFEAVAFAGRAYRDLSCWLLVHHGGCTTEFCPRNTRSHVEIFRPMLTICRLNDLVDVDLEAAYQRQSTQLCSATLCFDVSWSGPTTVV